MDKNDLLKLSSKIGFGEPVTEECEKCYHCSEDKKKCVRHGFEFAEMARAHFVLHFPKNYQWCKSFEWDE